ncbi:MAG: peptidyl-prolyl cis-trans isomerase, partial [Betaproteobacteria bacterium]|nr:peptidyl-prolyl cis-trans isomerase [Betaproteobacteria bacterium]
MSTHTMTEPDRSTFLNRWQVLLREPLVHFLALGLLLFVLDQVLLTKRGDPRSIAVPESVYEEARTLVSGKLNREPTDDDLRVLIDRWVDNEVLYREGLALGLDKGDTAIRDRVIFKSLGVVQAGLKLPPVDDETLKRWFEANRSRYETPTRFDFLEAVV